MNRQKNDSRPGITPDYRFPIFLNRIKMGIAQHLPSWVWTIRSRLRKEVSIDLETLSLLNSLPNESLTNPKELEPIIAKLGLCNENEPWEIPQELNSCYGQGLHIWQYPLQFAPYLAFIQQFAISTYLEIGIRHGGTFITTIEYLSRFNSLKKAIAIDINDSAGLEAYKESKKALCPIEFYRMDSRSNAFKNLIKEEPDLDLVFVDGAHDEKTVTNDINAVLKKAKIIALHDTASVNHPGVKRVWRKLKQSHSKQFEFFEFHEQYKSVLETSGGLKFFGIGVMVKQDSQITPVNPPEKA